MITEKNLEGCYSFNLFWGQRNGLYCNHPFASGCQYDGFGT